MMGIIDERLAGGKSSASSSSGGVIGSRLAGTTPVAAKKKGVADNSVVRGGLKVVGGALDILGRPGAAVLSAGRAGAESKSDKDTGAGAFLHAFTPHAIAEEAKGFGRGLSGKEHLTPTQAIHGRDATAENTYGKASSARGILGRGADFVASVATDPTTILTGGSKSAAQAGLKGIEETAIKQAAKRGLDEGATKLFVASVRETAAKKGVKAAIEEVGGKAAVKQTLIDTSLKAGANPRRGVIDLVKGAKKTPEAAADRFANKALSQAGRHLPETAIGRATIGTDEAISGAKSAVGERISNTAVSQFLARQFKSGAALEQTFGKEVAEKIKTFKGDLDAEKFQKLQDYGTRYNAARKSVGKVSTEDDNFIRSALESGAGRKSVEEKAPRLLPLYDAVSGIRKDSESRKIFAGLVKPTEARTLTGAAEKLVRSNNSKAAEILSKLPDVTEPVVKSGKISNVHTLYPNISIQEANKLIEPELQSAGVLKKGEHFFDEGAVKPVLQKAQEATEAVASKHYVDNLQSVSDVEGRPLLVKLEKGGKQAPAHYQTIDLGDAGQFAGPKEIIEDLKGVQDVITNNDDLKTLLKTYDKWEKWWKAGATTLPISGSFTARNARSNIFLNYLGGVKDPRDYVHAGKIQKNISKALSSKANRQALIDGKIEDVLSKTLGPEDYRLYSQARRLDIVGSTFSAKDLGLGDLPTPIQHKILGQLGTQGKVIKAGRRANQAVEENARLAHFIAKINQGADAKAASMSVKKYLFDYGDLSATEQKVLKRVIPFYTFMRKNTPLQIEELFKQPGKYTMRAHAVNATTGEPGENTPSYMQNGRSIPPLLAKLLGVSEDSQGITTPDNPFQAALDQGIKPVSGAVSLLPGAKKVIPKELQAESAGEAARTLYNVPGGPAKSLIDYLAQEGTGVNTFSGGRIKKGKGAAAERAAGALTPAYSRGRSAYKGSLTGNAKLNALRALLGLRVTPIEK